MFTVLSGKAEEYICPMGGGNATLAWLHVAASAGQKSDPPLPPQIAIERNLS